MNIKDFQPVKRSYLTTVSNIRRDGEEGVVKINTPGFFPKVVGHPGDTWLDFTVGNLVRFYSRTLG